ncbi:hypothetical protein PF327_05125 [Sulfurovum sp. XTW-4]|uniref:Uncharacterized protein n=1 Tax=Sulfurovum xiamenensis TaxID=3019066 RepID=A0ABT7QR75_9BACT|nr:hypothetical protein [Sulfurovum xiamenensis]MDM5263574.1 hypothetical protein [Sulfurovum xiamenensis]
MAKTKKLNITGKSLAQYNEKNTRSHFDSVVPDYAEEHYGYYLIYKGNDETSSNQSRLYFSTKHLKEFKISIGETNGLEKCTVEKSPKQYLIDLYPEYEDFIIDTMIRIVPKNLSITSCREYIWGCGLFLAAMKLHSYDLEKLSDVTNEMQDEAWNSLSKIDHAKNSKAHLQTFFGKLSLHSDKITQQFRKGEKKKSKLGYPTTTIYQLDYYARQDIKRIMKRVSEYQQWENEFTSIGYLFSLENLAKTYYENLENIVKIDRTQVRKLAKVLYNVELKCYIQAKDNETHLRPYRYRYENLEQELKHKKLLELSKSGKNITMNDERMMTFWLLELLESPLAHTFKDKYANLFSFSSLSTTINKRLNVELVDFHTRIGPTFHEIYPLYVLILIREGLNSEVLRSWQVHKTPTGKHHIGDNSGIATVIKGLKNRSKSIIWTPIKRDSIIEKYLMFYIDWLTPIYEKSHKNSLWQYRSERSGKKNISVFNSRKHISLAKQSIRWFFKRYDVFLPDGTKLDTIDHTRLRISNNFNDYLKGLSEFERQIKKDHTSINTQLHYDNMIERKEIQKNKLAKTVNFAEDIFRGRITREDNDKIKVFEGMFADCADPKHPTYPGKPKLHNNEVCSDWFMCLCLCDKSRVIPNIHGPAIYAWREYLLEEKKRLPRESDWEKEYLLQLDGIKSTIKGFTKEEKHYCKINMGRFRGMVRAHYKKKREINLKGSAC